MDRYIELVFGTIEIPVVVIGFFYLCIGILLSIFVDANKRDLLSTRTPFEFSYLFLIRDNWKRTLFTVFIGLISLRFSSDLFGAEPTMYMAFIIGYSADKFTDYIKKLQK